MDYPDQAVQLVLSFPPSGATDVLARAANVKIEQEAAQAVQ
ncbi:hypothetical protein RA280_29140 [Cupriavidus sp. CV2]|nr:hypothetical protein [Cupriavidus sp. CV2]MDW3685731.1 hypothetical protein [Cupriavidus sp. CV2]